MESLVELRGSRSRENDDGPRVYVHTFGCQMNVYDSERMVELLGVEGYRPVDDPAEADLILVNTCSVREKAEQKLMSALGRYRRLKAGGRRPLIGVAGCVAQQERHRLLEKAPFVDLVFGPDAVGKVGELVRRAKEEAQQILDTKFTRPGSYEFPRAEPDPTRPSATAFVTIQKGCDKVCTYCIVPFTRGREVSRPYPEVVAEVQRFVEAGVKEITLIGQNVNCYHGGCSFAELLYRVAEVPGLVRLRYTTSYPREMDEGVFRAHREIPQLARHLHLPVQSGSDRILALMRREHTAAEYLEKVARLREAVPDIALTTDIIVGFPGETEADFERTLELLEEVRFANLYSFIYSDRPGTWAARHSEELGRVPRAVQVRRLETLQALQREISRAYTEAYLGRRVEVLVEGPAKKDPAWRQGHTSHNWMVHFPGTAADAPVGALVEVEVEAASHFALSGRLVGRGEA
ncbi:MAG: tRNA (N6-isopentenyl adenosine(37)-C2)-methylthiotransferase MiaB [Deltaproteobacteria bacterium]|nr:MAG: tRNA (N6-isopentenyl adenosine(37)-C2)-methylthiotransferase MiaB [Deltaproteobacteria bacterium]